MSDSNTARSQRFPLVAAIRAGLPPMRAAAQLALALIILVVAALVLPYFCAKGGVGAGGWRVAIFGASLASLFCMLIAVGVGVSGRRSGVLWSSRNTYSLSRLQMVLWTWLVLSALVAVVLCRAWGLFDAAHPGTLGSALDVDIPGELLAVMGISFASSAAVPAILSLKAQAAPPSQTTLDAAADRLGADVHSVGRVYVRPDACPPLVKDLFQSDDASAAGTVDISKVQQFAVTVLLWTVYLAMLVRLMAEGTWSPVDPTVPDVTALPPLSQTFVYFLGISHAGYLAYKAMPPTGPSQPADPPPPPAG